MTLARRLNVCRVLRHHMDRACDTIAGVVEVQDDCVFADFDLTHLVQYRQERRRLDVAKPVGDQLLCGSAAFRGHRPAGHCTESRAECCPIRRLKR